MVGNKHISKIIIALMAVAVVLCFVAIGFSGKLTEMLGGTGVTMEYESKLFDTNEVISVDIQMDSDTWNEMLQNAMSEEYYVCDVVINGLKIKNVAIRPKGNTSLSAIAMDPDTNRYSFKLEFDHYVDGQTCYGLDKLILNNNYADATNMKEAVIYDMFQYIGAESSLYNYAKVSVNGEYWGVYLALEGVEQSFMLRNFGTQDGELYKPDSMEMGGGKSSSSGSSSSGAGSPPSMPNMPDMSNMPEMGDFNPGNMGSMPDFSGGMPSFSAGMPDMSSFSSGDMPSMPSGMPNMSGSSFGDMTSGMPSGDFSGGEMPNFNGQKPDFSSGMPSMGSFNPGEMATSRENAPEMSNLPDFSGGEMPDFSEVSADNMPDMSNFNPGDFKPSGGGFSMGGNGGANLNYTDDELDSYSTIWEGSLTKTGKKDHKRVITALKNISEGNELEKYLDVDNILKYMAVHVFAVNEDSLTGNMAHNYYLYEYNGQLNMFPWDYNLSFGGMSMGSSSNATEMVNDAIDTPFSGTKFFDALLSNEEYLERYHAYLRQLVEEYVNGGRFDEVYSRIRSQIDSLVETDPTAFYNYDEYQTAVGLLYDTVKLRAESIEGQLDGVIPSTDTAQRKDSSTFVDASHINVEDMGKFSMGGGGGFGGFGGRSSESSDEASDGSSSSEVVNTVHRGGRGKNTRGFGGQNGGFPGSRSSGNSTSDSSASSTPQNRTDFAASGDNTSGFGGMPSEDGGERPSFSGMPGQFGNMSGQFGGSSGSSQTKQQTLLMYGIFLAVMIVLLFVLKMLKRR